MKVMLFLLAALIAVVLWQRHENGNLTRSFERANRVATEQKTAIGMLKNQLSVSQELPGEMKPRRSVYAANCWPPVRWPCGVNKPLRG
jgi:hypothetical protein